MRQLVNVDYTWDNDNRGYILCHHCANVGSIQIDADWRYCPYCGRGLVKAIKVATIAKQLMQKFGEEG